VTNVMFKHTNDRHPSILAQCKTKTEAQKEMRRIAKGNRTVNAKVKRSANRIEFRYKDYGFAYYIEAD
jgi:hypothetical protein